MYVGIYPLDRIPDIIWLASQSSTGNTSLTGNTVIWSFFLKNSEKWESAGKPQTKRSYIMDYFQERKMQAYTQTGYVGRRKTQTHTKIFAESSCLSQNKLGIQTS